jgi:hypothetical protein
LRLYVDRKNWVARFLFNTLEERLIDNYTQARGYMGRMEASVVQTERLGEFNQQFQDNVDRGVFKALTHKEADDYKGPVNYISMVEVFNTGRMPLPP